MSGTAHALFSKNTARYALMQRGTSSPCDTYGNGGPLGGGSRGGKARPA